MEAKGSSKMAASAANQNCSFDCKWQPSMETHFEKPFQPIRVVLLIANSGPLCRLSFPRENCVQNRKMNNISLRCLGGATLNAAQVSPSVLDTVRHLQFALPGRDLHNVQLLNVISQWCFIPNNMNKQCLTGVVS